MPFKSEKQKGYLLAHPEITDKKGRPVGKKWAKKYGGTVQKNKTLAATLGVAATGTTLLASKKLRDEEEERKRKKGQVKKVLAPTSDDPDFNHEAAQRAFNLVMKMDDDAAEVFTQIVVADYFEETVEKNLGTLQRHLNEVIAKQLDDVKKAHLRLVSKGMEPEASVAYAQAIALIEKSLVSKVGASQRYGYQWEEKDFLRDPSSGRFRTKINHNQTTKIRNKTFKSIAGQDTPKEVRGNKLSEEDQIRFQDEYRQLAGFLDAVNASSGSKGDQSVMLHYRDQNGRPFSRLHFGSKPPVDDLADPSFRLMGAEAKPDALTAGGAAFGLATALGGGMNAAQVQAINNTESGEGTKFTNAWLSSGQAQNSNAKLYGRLAAGGSFLQGTHLGPKTEMAGKFASIVGSAGPQAEMVIGPTARKTAYRYRGTEKTPERRMGRAYAQGVAQGKVYGEPSVEQLALEAQGGRIREPRRAGQPTAAPAPGQIAQEKGRREDRAPTWRERELGRRAVVDHLRAKMPKKNLYELQLASGTTPPSEGVIINADGQLVTQAIGYGDDHYLPFNLKNLKGLKGGEYIRTRSVGGLTSEDIYTALMMGARQVTVTSRSGTYTMEFQEDFRGGRRHNDKARRMTRRYEQLLDAVQSQQVDRIDIDPEMRLEIEREVKEEMAGPTYRRADIQEAIRDRVDEFKENPYITEQDEKRAEAIINSRAAGAGDAERAKIRSQVYDDLMDQKETKFRLNSAGYKAALDALREQFPYYIAEPKWTPPKDQDKKIDTEQDYGYVEPGRNRPTAAAAGLFGAKNRGKFVGSGGKYSASEADYQGARKVGAGRLEQVEEGAVGGKDAHDKRRKAIAEGKLDEQVLDVAQELQKHAKANLDEKSLADPKVAAAVGMTRDELADKNNRSKFSDWAEQYTGLSGFKDLALKRKWESAVGHRERKPYDKGNIGLYPKFPPTFDEPAYELGAKPEVVAREIHRIDSKAKASVISGKIPLSGLSDDEQEKEWRALKQMHETLKADPTPLNTADLTAIGVDLHSPGLTHKLKTDPKAVEQQIEYLQRSRALTHGLTDEHRKTIIENRGKQVVTNETPSSEEQAKARENVKTQIAWGNKVVSEVETLRAQIESKLKESGLNTGHRESLNNILKEFPDERQMDQAKDAIAVMDGLQDQVHSKDDLGHLLQSGELKDDYKALMDASGLLESKREHIGILLNPPKKP